MQAEKLARYLTELKNKTGLSYEAISGISNRPESTVKNLCAGKTEDPRLDTVAPIIYALGGSIDEMLNPDMNKDEIKETSVLALKDVYEYQISTMKETSEAHISNIRAHYEQHISELKESHEKVEAHYEKRLADKRDVIDAVEKHLATVTKEKQWFKRGFCISILIFAALCIVELSNPSLGWIRF